MTDRSDTVVIHGDEWKWIDIEESVSACRKATWHREKWKRIPALVHKKGGSSSQYVGQQFDPAKTDLVQDGWTHDHCEICWWTLHETDNEDEGYGFTDGGSWVCLECYGKFLAAASPAGPAV